MTEMPSWGLCATIKAPAAEVLRFAAYHLDAGAHRLFIYLDEENPAAFQSLKAHPKIRVTTCDASYWDKASGGQRPRKHQVRQTFNATHAYRRAANVDWLIHMDVDEFLVSQRPVAEILAGLAPGTLCARIRPMEALAGGGPDIYHFKAFIPGGPDRARIVAALYPTYGTHLNGGFLSHLAGKVFVRTGADGIRIQIHNAFQNDIQIPTQDQTAQIDLAHMHAKNWESWLAAYRYRLAKGSYRPDLGPTRGKGGMTMNHLFSAIETDGGQPALRAFFDEVCADTPALRSRLETRGLLRRARLDLDASLSRHFSEFSAT